MTTGRSHRPSSPRIAAVRWGSTEVEGLGSFKDVKLWPGGGRAWDWRETGTDHTPGIQPADLEELLDHGCEVIVLGCGMSGALQVRPEALALLEAKGIVVHIDRTEAAVERYNGMTHTRKVGGLFHSTC